MIVEHKGNGLVEVWFPDATPAFDRKKRMIWLGLKNQGLGGVIHGLSYDEVPYMVFHVEGDRTHLVSMTLPLAIARMYGIA